MSEQEVLYPTPEDLRNSREQDFARKVVVNLVVAAGHQSQLPKYQDDWCCKTGSRVLDLDWFRERYPRFPLRHLFVRRFEADPLLLWPDGFTRFTSTPIFAAFQDYCKSHSIRDCDHSIGMIFSHGAKTLILHNLEDIQDGPRLMREVGTPAVLFQVQTLGTFLKAVGTSWVK